MATLRACATPKAITSACTRTRAILHRAFARALVLTPFFPIKTALANLIQFAAEAKPPKITFMRRADRLFRIVQFLRLGRLLTAQKLAEKLQVSQRTIYRDIQDLQLSGMPIEGEAGVGYTLRRDLD